MYEYAKKPCIHSACGSEKQTMPNSVQSSMNSINNVDVHSGTKLNLEGDLKSRIEQSLGFRMDNVELRESHDAADMDAKAFAKGNVVHFAPGQFHPETEEGRSLITHELSHVAQQARGGVHADIAGLNVNTSEALESQADSTHLDFSSPVDTSALPSLPSMDSQAAPVQGAFGRIKNFFKNAKTQFGFGRKSKALDQATKQINDEYNAENAEMMKAMQSSGFSPEEIEAQMLFQRINRASDREKRYGDAQGDLVEYSMNNNITDPNITSRFFSRLGRGKLTDKSMTKAGDITSHVRDDLLVTNGDMARADDMAAQLGPKVKARQNLAHMEHDGRSAEGDKYLNGRFGEGSHGALTDAHKFRFFLRQSYGKTDAEKDDMYDMFTNSKRNNEYLDYVRQQTNNAMAMDMDSFNTPDDNDMLEKSNAISDKTTDILALSDILKDNAQNLGYSEQFLDEDFGSVRQYLMSTKKDIRQRQREMTGEAEVGSTAASASNKIAFGPTGKNQGFADFKNRFVANKRQDKARKK
ncbi:MAG: DUF4157 domain-containing protein [Oscillospiraceae bacterium]